MHWLYPRRIESRCEIQTSVYFQSFTSNCLVKKDSFCLSEYSFLILVSPCEYLPLSVLQWAALIWIFFCSFTWEHVWCTQALKTHHTSNYFQSPFPTNSPSAGCREQFTRHCILSTQSTINFVQVNLLLLLLRSTPEGRGQNPEEEQPDLRNVGLDNLPMSHDTSASQQTNRTPSCWFCKVQTIGFVRTRLSVFNSGDLLDSVCSASLVALTQALTWWWFCVLTVVLPSYSDSWWECTPWTVFKHVKWKDLMNTTEN